ncbi:Oidioi.mRNA.OKI2018_I69.chr2.g6839.t1.cds [Oikopleura dioica]|uniref:Oidioi.mRNA.OKI2018_I69.chr2.g6839.t1.cds n=1 Tax=Oikopleura dioica TaxID=34765 RepID=A0ABN7T6M3_OIKDI|nr:Oidioi.mRNA.OKI2018_I69.chr2.g6839.t1.cds [Oikopleura dioica]
MFGHHVFDERWIRVLESVEVPAEDRFDNGQEPTEQEKMRIPSIYGLYERLKVLVDMLKIKVTYTDLLQLVEDHLSVCHGDPDFYDSSILAVLKTRMPKIILEKLCRLLFEEISLNKVYITPQDLGAFHRKNKIKISAKEIRMIIHEIDRSKEAKISFEDFSAFLARDTMEEFEEAKKRIESVSSDKTQ